VVIDDNREENLMRFRNALLLVVTVGALTASSRVPNGNRAPMIVKGIVRFSGNVPAAKPIDMSADAYCSKAHPGGPAPVDRPLTVDEGGGVRDVIVYIKQGVPSQRPAASTQPVVLDQQGCIYAPRVLALQVGQTLVVRNSDETLHNVHVSAKANRQFNIGQPIKGLESKRTFSKAEVGIAIACDVHGWMHGALAVFDHPFFAISSADGSFSIQGLPPGEYVIETWHESLGTKTQRLVVTENGTEPANLVISY
jgi:plastocyanin